MFKLHFAETQVKVLGAAAMWPLAFGILFCHFYALRTAI